MTDTTAADEPEAPPQKRGKSLIIALLCLIIGLGGGYSVIAFDLFPKSKPKEEKSEVTPLPDVAFVSLDPVIISLADGSDRHLRFKAEIEVPSAHLAEVSALKPRIVDVLNSYLRAVETEDLEDPAALITLRSQMMRRIELVVGVGRARDLLVMEFVLN
jgi:flagellar FliL protein